MGERPKSEKPSGPPPRSEDGKQFGPILREIAFNGVAFDAPAPLHIILKGYSIPSMDDVCGHINLDNNFTTFQPNL